MFYRASQQACFSVEKRFKLGQKSKVQDWPEAPPERLALNMDFTSCVLMYKIDNLHFVQKWWCPEPCHCHKQKLAFLSLKRERKKQIPEIIASPLSMAALSAWNCGITQVCQPPIRKSTLHH